MLRVPNTNNNSTMSSDHKHLGIPLHSDRAIEIEESSKRIFEFLFITKNFLNRLII